MKRVSSCEGKEQLTPQLAAKIVRKMNKRKDRQRFVSYRCEYCGYHHIGSRK